MGKGSGRRPPAISDKELEDRWAAAFGAPHPMKAFHGVTPDSMIVQLEGVDTGAQGPQIADSRA